MEISSVTSSGLQSWNCIWNLCTQDKNLIPTALILIPKDLSTTLSKSPQSVLLHTLKCFKSSKILPVYLGPLRWIFRQLLPIEHLPKLELEWESTGTPQLEDGWRLWNVQAYVHWCNDHSKPLDSSNTTSFHWDPCTCKKITPPYLPSEKSQSLETFKCCEHVSVANGLYDDNLKSRPGM